MNPGLDTQVGQTKKNWEEVFAVWVWRPLQVLVLEVLLCQCTRFFYP